jgi:hypothetical protein
MSGARSPPREACHMSAASRLGRGRFFYNQNRWFGARLKDALDGRVLAYLMHGRRGRGG